MPEPDWVPYQHTIRPANSCIFDDRRQLLWDRMADEILALGLAEERLVAEEIARLVGLVDALVAACRAYVWAMIQRVDPGEQDMQLPAHYAVHPHLVPVSEWFRGKHVDAVLRTAVLRIAACALLLDFTAQRLDGGGLGLSSGDVAAVIVSTYRVVERKVGDPRIVFQNCTFFVEFPEGDLLQSGNEFPVIRRSRVEDRARNIHDGRSNVGALGLKADNLDLGEAHICWGLRHGRQGEEVLGRVIEAGEITQRRDASSSLLVEEPRRNRCRAVGDELQVGGVEVPLVDIGDRVEIALLKANGTMICSTLLEA